MATSKITYCLLMLPLLIFGCQKSPYQAQEDDPATGGMISNVTMILPQYDGDEVNTKTSYDYDNKRFLWAAGDAVGIVNGQGGHLKFLVGEDYYGSTKASFDGRGYALLPSVSYAGYSPFYPDFDLNPNALPISYQGQSQSGNDDYSGLGDYSYIVAMGNAPESGSLTFKFKSIGSPHRYNVPAPAGEYSQMNLAIGSQSYILEGTVNLLADSDAELIEITPIKVSDKISLNLTGVTLSAPTILQCWMMVPPADLSSDIIKITLTKSDGTSIIASVKGRDCPANNRRFFYAQSSVFPSEQEVASEGGILEVCLVKTTEDVEIASAPQVDWLTLASSSTEGLVTTYTFSVAENTGAERTGTVSFTETSTGLVNTVSVIQKKAGTVIGIGGWDQENHSGTAN